MAKWHYYTATGERVGPIRTRDLVAFAQSGTITPETQIEDESGRIALAKNAKRLSFPQTTNLDENPFTLPAPGMVSSFVDTPSVEEHFVTPPLAEEYSQRVEARVFRWRMASWLAAFVGIAAVLAIVAIFTLDESTHPVKADKNVVEAPVDTPLPPPNDKPSNIRTHNLRDEDRRLQAVPLALNGSYKLKHEFAGHSGTRIEAHFSADGKRIVTADWETVRIWDAETGREIAKIDAGFNYLTTNNVLLTKDSYEDNTKVRRWDTRSGNELPTLEMPKARSMQCYYSSDSRYLSDKKLLALYDYDRTFIWDVESGRKLLELSESLLAKTSSPFSSDGQRVATQIYDDKRRIKILDVNSGRELQRVDGEVAFLSRDGARIATGVGDDEYKTRIWDVNSGRELQMFEGMPRFFFPDGEKVATYYRTDKDDEKIYRIWDVKSGRELQKYKGDIWKFSSDEKKFYTQFTVVNENRMVQGYEYRILDTKTCKELCVFRAKSNNGYFSSNGRRFVTYDGRSFLQVWDTESGKEMYSVEGFPAFYPHRKSVTRLSSSNRMPGVDPRRGHANASLRDGTTRILDIDSGKELQQFEGDVLRFSQDEKSIATVGKDDIIRIWVWQ